jgi:hypothetical protein
VRESAEHFRRAEELGIGSKDAWHLWALAHNAERLEALHELAPEVPEEEWCCFDHPDPGPPFDAGLEDF